MKTEWPSEWDMILPRPPRWGQAEQRCGEIPGQAQKNDIRRKRQTIRKSFKKQFARKQMDCYTEDKKKLLAAKRRELRKAKKRMAEIDTLIQKIYEDNASGKLSDERYATLSLSYEEEQKTLKAAVPEMQAYLETETDKTESLQRFIQKVKQITELKALTPELIHEFVDKIVVYAPRYLDGKRVQLLDIYYSGVGILHELTPEEMEETFQHHLAERNKEKTA